MFKPYLKQIFDYNIKVTKWLESDELKGYDVLLDQFEPNYTVKEYDNFFETLKEKLVPFVNKVANKKLVYNDGFTKLNYDIDKQKKFIEYIRDVMGFSKDKTVIKESEHPFTSGFSKHDVRITIHYYENILSSAIFSAIHEMGHGLYEMNIDDKIDETMSGGGSSLAMHESQSRFMENIVARSKEFWNKHFDELQKVFPKELQNVTPSDFYKYVNTVERSFIRTEADELTYSLHILIRYEIEKEIIAGKVTVDNLKEVWNQKYKDYLGLDVTNDSLGVLQDVHWAYGNIGYFPTYALGSAISAQLYHYMKKDFDVDKAMGDNNISEITNWLKEKIHKHGASKYTTDILKLATGEEFNPNYYIDYLINKYSELYNI